MSFLRAKTVFAEQLEPGLQYFPSEAAFEGERVADLQHRQATTGFQQIAPVFYAAMSAIPVVGGLLAAVVKKDVASGEAEFQQREAEMFSALAAPSATASFVDAPQPLAVASSPRSFTMFEDVGTGWTDLLQRGVNTFLQYQQQRQSVAPVAMPGGAAVGMGLGLGVLPAVGGMVGRAIPSMFGGAVVGAIGGAVVRGGRMVMTAIGNITKERVVAIAKTLGIQAAATALGIGAIEIAQYVLDEEVKKRRRRGGGVTGAQLRTTRKTMRKVMGMARSIRSACSETGFLQRRSASRKAPYCPPPRVIVTKR